MEAVRFTPEIIKTLEPHQIFVFGSNTQGMHGKGAAKVAWLKFGAVQTQAKGLQGQSYAIITKDLRKGRRSISLEEISQQIDELFEFAANHTELEFLITKIGCGLGGFTEQEIASCFHQKQIPPNVVMPIEFWYPTQA